MSGPPQLDVNSVNAPPPGSGAGYDFLNAPSEPAAPSSLFGGMDESAATAAISGGTLPGAPSGEGGRKATKPALEPADREDFSAEAMEKRAMEQRSRMQQEQQRRAAYQGTVGAYNALVPAPPPDPLWKRFQPYAVYITLLVALLLLFLFFWTRKKGGASASENAAAAAAASS